MLVGRILIHMVTIFIPVLHAVLGPEHLSQKSLNISFHRGLEKSKPMPTPL
jgi:hypothetical protein